MEIWGKQLDFLLVKMQMSGLLSIVLSLPLSLSLSLSVSFSSFPLNFLGLVNVCCYSISSFCYIVEYILLMHIRFSMYLILWGHTKSRIRATVGQILIQGCWMFSTFSCWFLQPGESALWYAHWVLYTRELSYNDCWPQVWFTKSTKIACF